MSSAGGYDSPGIAEMYDYHPAYAGRADLPFYLDLARAAAGKVLELGCGTGRLLIPIARAGVAITGLDLSPAMLDRCKQKLQNEPWRTGAAPHFLLAGMADFSLPDRVNLITIPFRAFQHLPGVEEQLACLRCAHRHLTDGGRLVLDLFQTNPRRMYDPAYMKEAVDVEDAPLPGGRRFRRTQRVLAFHRAEQINDLEFLYYVTHPDGRQERFSQAFPFRYFFRYEVEHLLARCGFRVAELFGNYDRSPLADDSTEMIFVAEKAAR